MGGIGCYIGITPYYGHTHWHGFDIAVGMSPEGCSKRVHILTVAAQNVLIQDEIDANLHDEEQDSYLSVNVWRSTESPYNLFTF